MIKQTLLYSLHIAAGASFVPFCGWDMPLHYGSELAEYQAVCTNSGVFDVSHRTIVDLIGTGARQSCRHLFANDVDKLPHAGRALYSCMLNHRGGILDDVMIYYRGSDNYRLVLNAVTRDKVLAWLSTQTQGMSIGLEERTDLAMLAVQGPHAITNTLSCLTPEQADALITLKPFDCVDIEDWFFVRTGDKSEDGLDIMLPTDKAASFWTALLRSGIQPIGLGARNSLRLEAGKPLYGQDMDETVTPAECGLSWSVAMEPVERDFIGRAALETGLVTHTTLVGLLLSNEQTMQSGFSVWVGGEEGVITSAAYSPKLARSIAFARLPKKSETTCRVKIQNKMIPATIVKLPFVKRGQRND